MFWIYAFVNKVNDKAYVGQSVQPQVRKRQHRKSLREGVHHCAHFQRAWNQYGGEAFEHFCIASFESSAEANEAEQFYISWYRDLGLVYNSKHGGVEAEHRGKSRKQSREHIANRAQAIREGITPEFRARISELKRGNKYFEGKSHSEETKQAMSESRKGELNPNYGKTTSDTQKQAASKTWKGVKRGPMSEETKHKLREARARQVSTPCSDATKEKIRQRKLERDAAKKA